MAEVILLPSADIGAQQWNASFGGMDHYDHVNDIPPQGHFLTAQIANITDYFKTDYQSGNPGDIATVTAIQLAIYKNYTWNFSASWYGCRFRLKKADDSQIATWTDQDPPNDLSPYWTYHTFSGLSLTESDLNGLRLEITSVGVGWTFMAALYAILELVPITVTYTPVPSIIKVHEFDSAAKTIANVEANAQKTVSLVSRQSSIATLESRSNKVIELVSIGKKDFDYR